MSIPVLAFSQNGCGGIARILTNKNINGKQLAELAEIETISWGLNSFQRNMLFEFISQLKDSSSIQTRTANAPIKSVATNPKTFSSNRQFSSLPRSNQRKSPAASPVEPQSRIPNSVRPYYSIGDSSSSPQKSPLSTSGTPDMFSRSRNNTPFSLSKKQVPEDDGYLSPKDLAKTTTVFPIAARSGFLQKNILPNRLPSENSEIDDILTYDYVRIPGDADACPSNMNLSNPLQNYNISRNRKLYPLPLGAISGNQKNGNSDLDKIEEEVDRRVEEGFFSERAMYVNGYMADNVELRKSLSGRIEPRPLPPIPTEDESAKNTYFSSADPHTYIEVVNDTSEECDTYENISNFVNKEETRIIFSEVTDNSRLVKRNEVKISPFADTLALKLSKELKQRSLQFGTEKKSTNTNVHPFESPTTTHDEDDDNVEYEEYENLIPKGLVPDEIDENDLDDDEDFEKKEVEGGIYGNIGIDHTNGWKNIFFPKPPVRIHNAAVNSDSHNIALRKFTGFHTKTDKLDEIHEGGEDKNEGGIYGNIGKDHVNGWKSIPPPRPPKQRHEVVSVAIKEGANDKLHFSPVRSTPTRRGGTDEGNEEDSDQIHESIKPIHKTKLREFNSPSKSLTNSNNIREKRVPDKVFSNAILDISSEPYYRTTDRKGAKQLLRPLGDGSFLFRPSEKYFLVLTTKQNKKFYHIGIDRTKNGKFTLNAQYGSDLVEFSSLQEFTDYFTTEPLIFDEDEKMIELYLKTDSVTELQ
ncbi:hypothetical protein JTB14_028663 [Gonioctena quinquepunctata]|nr:hypothetical protein JTB14_028663 [Gonioctena quinquepunctata]